MLEQLDIHVKCCLRLAAYDQHPKAPSQCAVELCPYSRSTASCWAASRCAALPVGIWFPARAGLMLGSRVLELQGPVERRGMSTPWAVGDEWPGLLEGDWCVPWAELAFSSCIWSIFDFCVSVWVCACDCRCHWRPEASAILELTFQAVRNTFLLPWGMGGGWASCLATTPDLLLFVNLQQISC